LYLKDYNSRHFNPLFLTRSSLFFFKGEENGLSEKERLKYLRRKEPRLFYESFFAGLWAGDRCILPSSSPPFKYK